MKRIALLLVAVAAVAGVLAFMASASGYADEGAAPIFVTKIVPGYRDWRLISVAHEEGELNDFRAEARVAVIVFASSLGRQSHALTPVECRRP